MTTSTPASTAAGAAPRSAIDCRVHEGVAFIGVSNPPVNALSHHVRLGIHDALATLSADPSVRAIVIACRGKTFFSGADIRELGQPPRHPTLRELLDAIEGCAKPVIAAIHGKALGGGLELALACHARVATVQARIGLPEVKLGILPGAGGTQRLPRLVGADAALPIMLSGTPISARQARDIGAVDALAQGEAELEAQALKLAGHLAAAGTARRTRGLRASLTNPKLFDDALATLARTQRGFKAPPHIVRAVQAAVELPFAEGMARERALYEELVRSPESRAQRHVFFAEREIARIPGLSRETHARPISRIGILGAGTMGTGIAIAFVNAGYAVTLLEVDEANLARGTARIHETWNKDLEKGRIAAQQLAQRKALLASTMDWAALEPCDMVIEAVFEDIAIKRETFARLDAVCKPAAILATNTSYLDIEQIAGATRRPRDVVGMHFFSPANIMKLLEVVRTKDTADDVCATAMQVGKAIGKTPVLVGNCHGFVGNRMLAQRTREAWFMLEEGASPSEIDAALTDFGFPMGPLAMLDLAGLDIGWRNRTARLHLLSPRETRCDLLDQICARGRYGQKTGSGVYKYAPGGRTGQADPAIDALVQAHQARHGLTPHSIDTQECVDRCVLTMVNEAARILEEGIVPRPHEVDMTWILGYGFPAWRGGPLYYADQLGLPTVLARICEFRDRFGADHWTPAPLLERLAREGRSFYEAAVPSAEPAVPPTPVPAAAH